MKKKEIKMFLWMFNGGMLMLFVQAIFKLIYNL